MDYLFEWTPDEWEAFVTGSKEKASRILADEKLFNQFDIVVKEQIAIAEESGGTAAQVLCQENILDIIWRFDFV